MTLDAIMSRLTNIEEGLARQRAASVAARWDSVLPPQQPQYHSLMHSSSNDHGATDDLSSEDFIDNDDDTTDDLKKGIIVCH